MKLAPVIIFIICLMLVLIWFSKGFIFAGGEGGIPFYNLTNTVERLSYVWIDEEAGYPGVGGLTEVPYYLFLKMTFLPANMAQGLHFFIVMFTGTISVYFLLKITLEEELKRKTNLWGAQYVPLSGAFFYLLNPFSMTQIFGRSLNIQYFSFALLPLFLALFVKGLKSKNLFYGFLALIPSAVFAGAYGSFGYALALWFLAASYSIFHLWNNHKNKKSIIFTVVFFLFTFAGWALVNAFWIWPVFKLAGQQLSGTLSAVEENLGSLRGVSKQFSFPVLIRLLHTGYFYEDLYGIIYFHPFFVLISWIIPVVSLFSIPYFRKISHFKFYLSLFLASLFVSLGSNFPLGFLFEFLFTNIPVLQIFRNPYEKFGLIFLLAYVPFFAIGALALSQKLRFLSLMGIIVLVCVVFVWPMWKGIFAGGYRINTWIKVPDYYREANEWFNQQTGDFRLLHLPLIPGDGIRYKWEHPYQGIEPSEFLFDRVSIAQNIPFNKAYYNILLQRIGIFQPNIFGSDPDLTNSQFRAENLYEELAKLNIRYIVLHNDIDTTYGGFKSPEETKLELEKQPNIVNLRSFGELDIFKVNIPDNIHLIYSPTVNVNYQKINPTFYKAHVASDILSDLFFLSVFNANWEASIDGQKIGDHYQLFSYANAWKISQQGNFDVELKYKPQELVEQSRQISKYSLAIIAVISFIYLTLRRAHKV